MTIKSPIGRPTVTIEHNTNGGSTYVARHFDSDVEYVRIGWAKDDTTTKKLMAGFKREFDKRAKLIETGKSKPEHIMSTFVAHGWFRKRNFLGEVTNTM